MAPTLRTWLASLMKYRFENLLLLPETVINAGKYPQRVWLVELSSRMLSVPTVPVRTKAETAVTVNDTLEFVPEVSNTPVIPTFHPSVMNEFAARVIVCVVATIVTATEEVSAA